MEFISLTWWQLLIMVAATLLAGTLPTLLSNKSKDKRETKHYEEAEKQRKTEQDKLRAENLYSIIKPLLQTQVLTYYKPFANKEGTWEILSNILSDQATLDVYIAQLFKHTPPRVSDPTDLQESLKNLIFRSLIQKHDLEEFIARYAPKSTYHELLLDINLLNTDIQFINEVLGLHISEYRED